MRSWQETPFTRATGARLPLVAAPMAGGPTTPELVAEVSAAGGLGVLAAGYTSPDDLRGAIAFVRSRTGAPFGVNVLLPQPFDVDPAQVDAALHLLAPYAEQVGVTLELPSQPGDDVDALLEVALAARVPFLGFTFGTLPADQVEEFRRAGTLLCGTATTVAEAQAVVAAGADLVCVQGAEAGGHRGGFLPGSPDEGVALAALVPLVRDAVDVPLLAAGGLMDGRGVAAALALGADAAALGTAFLLCPEAGTSAPYWEAVRQAAETGTTLTKAFSGKPARGLRNRMTEDLAGAELPPYPVMNALTRPLRRAAAAAGRAELLSLWAGQGVPAARELPAAELVASLERETAKTLERLGR